MVTFENLVSGVTYVWKEAGLGGYLLNEDNTGIWSVEEHDVEIQYTAKDNRRPGSITVTKQNSDGQPLFGGDFPVGIQGRRCMEAVVYYSETLAKWRNVSKGN